MSLKKISIVLGFALVLAVIITACTTATPTPAPTEPPAPTQAPEPTAVPPTPTEDPTVAIAAAVEASAHTDEESMVFHDWDAATPAEVPTTCAKCHSEAGYIDFITDGKVDAAVPAPQGVFSCNLCHNDNAKSLTSVTFPSGAVIENLGPEAICMTCHQGRESKVSVDAKLVKFGENLDPDAIPAPYKDDKGNDVKLGFSNVHYYAAAGTLYGSQTHTGYEYDGKLYDVKHQHVDGFNTCIGCHDQHSLEVKVEACKECHGESITDVESLKGIREPSSAMDYDGDGDKTEGVAHEIEGLQAVLLSSMQAYAKEVVGTGIAYDPAAYPYWFADADGDGKGDTKDDKPVAYNGLWTPRLLKAAYNYQVSIKDPGAFAHGGKYIIELLFDSIEDVNSSEKLTTKFDATTLTREDAGHFDGAGAAWRHWDVDSEGKPVYTVEAACAKCHSASGLPTLLAGQEIPETGVPAGNGLMCVTCHDVQAGFPARFKVNDVVLPSGKTVTFGQDADSNLCIMCHQGRASKKSVDDRIAQFNAAGAPDTIVEAIKDANGNDVKFGFINSHYLGIANEWFGTDAQGAYEYDGKTYVGVNTHPALEDKPGCVGCHDVHNGEVKVELCQQCHGTTDPDTIRGMSDATIDYNGNGNTTEGVRDEYRALREVLYAEIQTYAKKTTGTAIVYDTNAYPYWYADANGNGERDADEKAFTTWTPRLLKAAYNYNFFRKTPGAYAHNAKYSIQVIIDSIEDLGGDISKFVRP